MTNQIQFHKIFSIYIYSNSNTVSCDCPIYTYKQLRTKLTMLTEITMLKPVMFKMLENHYTGKKAIPCTILDSLSYPFFKIKCHFATRFHPFAAKSLLYFIHQRLVKKELPKDSSISRTFHAEYSLFKC